MSLYPSTTEGFEWLRARTGYAYGPAFQAIEARDTEGSIVGVIGMDLWMGKSAQVHIALEDPRAFMPLCGATIRYAFAECGFNALLALFPVSVRNTLRLTKRIGFNEAGRIKSGAKDGSDLLLMELRPENCLKRWQVAERRAA